MKHITATFLLLLMAACGGLPKPGPQAALYDFGILPADRPPVTLPLRLVEVEAAPGLEASELRYRLAYQNPARVFAYTESRWIAAPGQLIARRIEQRLRTAPAAFCRLHVRLETFDHIFDTPSSSTALVRIDARLVMNGSRTPFAQVRLEKTRAAPSADARGGVEALTVAADEAIASLLDWAQAQDCNPKLR